MKTVHDCISKRYIKKSMDDPIHSNIAGLYWGMSQINQQMFNKIGDLLGADIPNSWKSEKDKRVIEGSALIVNALH